MKYFAYGSNMSVEQMKSRGCFDSRFVGIAKLDGYDLVFCGQSPNWEMKGTANLSRLKNGYVWGALFEASEDCLKKLDVFEHVPKRRKREAVVVKDMNGTEHTAIVYILKTDLEINQPSKAYFNRVIEGAKQIGLPDDYINNIDKQKRP